MFKTLAGPAGSKTCGTPLKLPPAGGAVVCLLANMGSIIPNYKPMSRKKWPKSGFSARVTKLKRCKEMGMEKRKFSAKNGADFLSDLLLA